MEIKRIIKTIIKTIITYFYNWPYILKFKNFGRNSFIGKRTIINLAGQGIFIGNNVRFGNDLRLSCYSSTSAQVPYIEIQDSVYAGNHISILTADTVVIENNVLLASYINIIGENHSINPESAEHYGKQPLQASSIIIKEGAWIGQSVSILSGKSGIIIGKKSIIGTGSVVTKSIPDYSIAVGNPAKVIKTYNFDKHVWENLS
ncbi:TPA: hypothetical protein U2B44_001247 [Streptococcus suis]|nr:hypothetical protein [Streptococcus suis]